MSNHYTFTLPRSFYPMEFLPQRLWARADDARWLISTIVIKTANRSIDLWGCVQLDSQILRRVMYKHDATDVFRALEGGAIEITSYRVGVRCRGYRLAQRYLGDRCQRVPITDPRLLARIQREQQRMDAEERQARWLPIHDQLNEQQQRLTIGPEADVIVDQMPDDTRLCQDVLVQNIRQREFHLSVGKTCRVFNNITGLSRKLRPAVRIGGEPMGSVDITCAQPGLLAMILTQATPPSVPKARATYKHAGTAGPAGPFVPPLLSLCAPASLAPSLASPDVACFCDLASSGSFYERLVMASGLERDVVKLAFLRDVLAKKGKYPSEVENAFRLEFPGVYRFIRFVNRDDHGELIRLLQRMEAWLVIEHVCPRLIGRVPTISLHDAIYSTPGSLAAVESAFMDTFDAIGCRLALKVEP